MLCIRLICHAPHDDAGMILVAGNEIADHILVMGPDVKGPVRISFVSGTDSHCPI